MRNQAGFAVVAMTALTCLGLGGCGGLIIAGLPLSQISTGLTVASIAVTGKGTSEHALDLVTGRDCRFLDALMRDEREICEEKNSLATQDDFHGVFVWLDEKLDGSEQASRQLAKATERQLAGGPIGKVARLVGAEDPIAPQRAEPPILLAERAQQPARTLQGPAEDPLPATAAGNEPLGSLATRIGLRREAPAAEPETAKPETVKAEPAAAKVELAAAEAPQDSLRAMALRIGLRREDAALAQAGRALVERDESGPEPDFIGALAQSEGDELEIDTSFREFDRPKM